MLLPVHVCLLLPSLLFAGDPKVDPPGFTFEEIHSGNGMTALDFDPDGRMYVCEKQGRVLVFSPDGKGGYGKPAVFADLLGQVNPENESGLLGIVLDRQFSENRFLYVFYTSDSDQKLVRLTGKPDFLEMESGSEKILLEGLPRTATNHKAGDIHIHPKDPGAIYLALGDDTKREFVQDLEHYNGKLLRLDISTGKGLADNPFYDGDTESVASRIWATGFRNPFRFAFVPDGDPGFIYVSENGDGTDRVAQVKRGADAGWGRDGDKGLISPEDKNTTVLHTSRPCMTAITIAPKGPFAPDGPVLYAENWFTKELLRWKLDGENLSENLPIPSDGGKPFLSDWMCVHTTFGPDGALYMTQTYFADSVAKHHKLARVVPGSR